MKFEEAIDLKHWQNIQDMFSSLIGISLKTLDGRGELVVRPANIAEVCSEAIAGSPAARKKCWQWYPQLSDSLNKSKTNKFAEHLCPLGLKSIALTLSLNNSDPVYLVAGPVVMEKPNDQVQISKRIQDFGIDEQKFFECFNKLPVVNAEKLNESFELLNSITFFMGMLDDFGQKYSHINVKEDKEKIEFVLKSFLDVAMRLCAAERGSVMMFEKSKQELSIKDAKGLSEEIVSQTKIKPGEGLAGMSISRRKALFLNDQLKDREVRLRMNRPKIKSAFVIPVFYKTEILGVISVGTTKKPNRFSDKLMELLNELVGLALEKISLQ